MQERELQLLKKLDIICGELYVSYKIEVNMGIGTKVTVYFCNDVELVIGGLDFDFDDAIEGAIKALSNLEKKEEKK